MLNIPNRYGEPDDFIVKGRGFHEQRISIFGGGTLQSMYDRKDGCFIVCLIFHEHLRDATKRFQQCRMRPPLCGDNPFSCRTADRRKQREQASETCIPQWLVRSSRLTTEPLDCSCRAMTDAIDREDYVIRPAHQARQQPCIMFKSAIMVQKTRSDPLDQRLQSRNLIGAATYIQEGNA